MDRPAPGSRQQMRIHVSRGPSEILAVADDDRPTRYCFGCRRHTRHTWRLAGGQEFYDPVPLIACEKCGEDRTDFPGLDRDGPKPVPAGVHFRAT